MLTNTFLDAALDAARAAADAAAHVIARHYRGAFAVETKADMTPVTIADREAEAAIKRVLKAKFPDHAFYGEEEGREGEGDLLWLIDPIDGTRSFVRGYPMFSTQIALQRGGERVLGVSSAPLYGELAFAERGQGAWLNGRRLKVSAVASLEEAALSTGNLKTLASGPGWARFGAIVRRLNRIRGYGDFLHYHLLAAGRIDAVLESDVHILDIAALVTLVEEAGGRCTALDGAPLGLDSSSVLATNAVLHAPLLAALA
jgi:histidinol-phosphatase